MWKNASIVIIMTFGLWLLVGCLKDLGKCKDTELSIRRHDYTTTVLRVDGYYFGRKDNNIVSTVFYLYRNGIFFNTGAGNLWEDAKNGIIKVDTQNSSGKQKKTLWGTFDISGNIVEIEQWQPVQYSCNRIYYSQGNILNDTTFVIIHTEYRTNDSKGVDPQNVNDTFYFHQSGLKPDSTNDFIQ